MNRLIILLALVGALRVWAAGPNSANPWSFSPLQPLPLPKTEREDWIQTRVDAFILARLEAAGLAPSPATDPRRRRDIVRTSRRRCSRQLDRVRNVETVEDVVRDAVE